jgi:predicted nucleic acid-binding protein
LTELWASGAGRLSVDAAQILSEDLNAGRSIAGIKIVNPLTEG